MEKCRLIDKVKALNNDDKRRYFLALMTLLDWEYFREFVSLNLLRRLSRVLFIELTSDVVLREGVTNNDEDD